MPTLGPRTYTAAEIDRMRIAIAAQYPEGESYTPNDRAADVERRLQTYILGGIDPAELDPA